MRKDGVHYVVFYLAYYFTLPHQPPSNRSALNCYQNTSCLSPHCLLQFFFIYNLSLSGATSNSPYTVQRLHGPSTLGYGAEKNKQARK